MSRTRNSRNLARGEFNSKRPTDYEMYQQGKSVKDQTHRLERRENKDLIQKELRD